MPEEQRSAINGLVNKLTRVCCVEWHTFLPRGVDSNSIVLDLGANHGSFSDKMQRYFGCFCHAIEASPILWRELNATRQYKVYNYALTDKNGMLEFNISTEDMGSSILDITETDRVDTVDVEGIRLDSFLDKYGIERVDLLKIDIEGAEVGMFDSLSDEFLQEVPQITVEFHDFCKVTPESEVKRISQRLEKLGFRYFRMSGHGNQDALFVNHKKVPISRLEQFYIRVVVRNLLGAMRVLLKALKINPRKYPYYI